MDPAWGLAGFTGTLTIDLTALLLPPLTFTIWRIQSRRERRDRTIRVFQMYESQTLKNDRRDAWRYLTGSTGRVVPLTDLMQEPDLDRINAYGSCIGVLKFFATIDRLLETRHLDRRLVLALLESDRASWAEAFERAGIRPDVDSYVADHLRRLAQTFEGTSWLARSSRWSQRSARPAQHGSPDAAARQLIDTADAAAEQQ